MTLHHRCLEHTQNYSMKISAIISSVFLLIHSRLCSSPFPSLQRYNTNPSIATTKSNPSQVYTFKDYQSATVNNNIHRPNETRAEPEPLTSIYTFPSLVKPTNNWRKTHQQSSPIDATSSAWRLFGLQHLHN